ncbi:SsgA family sporulation/cell division regulator [Streptomyces sp. WMMB 322]|uniref:SsgA family sporulation/cell division regulator n=1 Tax=Streptomyces sp. WMMB 322 TaxID=1286821 RepID=UPI0006E2A925|nr:SsgA family sporulation/cell division regulator [Streptomyces sp. WMMB 322]SCK10101.1 Streptomyces sporulation and cell division protein, SsgA [Streptomyces sp. WMMB 322]
MSAVFDHAVQARLIADPHTSRDLRAALRYDTTDPLAVRIVFPADASLDGGEVAWAFGRELLDAGLHEPAGEGDVHVWPRSGTSTVIELLSHEGVAVVEFDSADLRCFLLRSYDVVAAGQEHGETDVETGLAALLRGV